MGCAGLQNTNMDVLQQSSLILVTLTSKGKFLYIFGGAGPESARTRTPPLPHPQSLSRGVNKFSNSGGGVIK